MNMNKKFSLSISFLAVLSVLTACSSNIPSAINNDGNQTNLFAQSKVNDVLIADLGNGKKTNASLSFKVNLDSDKSSFNTKNNVSGNIGGATSAVLSIQVWLLESTTGSPPAAGATVTPVSGSAFSYTNASAGSNPTFTYTNIDTNTSGKSYYVAVAAYNVVSGSQSTANNITNKTTAANRIMIGGTEPAAISDGGGDTTGNSGSNTGSVNVSSLYTVSTTNGLTVDVTLADAMGATIDSSVTLINGNSSIPATTVQ